MAMDPTPPASPSPKRVRKIFWIGLAAAVVLAIAAIIISIFYNSSKPLSSETTTSTRTLYDPSKEPELNEEVALSGLDHPWDIAFLPDGQALFT